MILETTKQILRVYGIWTGAVLSFGVGSALLLNDPNDEHRKLHITGGVFWHGIGMFSATEAWKALFPIAQLKPHLAGMFVYPLLLAPGGMLCYFGMDFAISYQKRSFIFGRINKENYLHLQSFSTSRVLAATEFCGSTTVKSAVFSFSIAKRSVTAGAMAAAVSSVIRMEKE